MTGLRRSDGVAKVPTRRSGYNGIVLLQIMNDVKALRITVDLVADWRAFGLWGKSFTFTTVRPPLEPFVLM
jgi:hypothetical protein